jgi:glycosyltransferase involved in cell wall biosynthesis
MKIALISDCYVPRLGGIEMQVHDLARHLQNAGHEVVVITTTAGPTVVDGVRVHRIDAPLLPFDIPFTPKAFRSVGDVLATEKVDVAHFHGGVVSPLAYVCAYTAQKMGVPVVITLHCMWSYATPVFSFLNLLTKWGSWPVVLSAVSDVAARPLRKISSDPERVRVLPNGIENDQWKISHNDDDDVITFVSVMRLAPRKRPMHLLRMMRNLVRSLPSDRKVRLLIIGDGPELPQLEKFVRQNGLTNVVQMVGRRKREEIRDIYSSADVFVAPANLESFGIAALEARCAGLPVIAKQQTGIREFVEHEKEGLLARDDRDMTAQMRRIVLDDDLRNRMAQHNQTVTSSVDWGEVCRKNIEAYQLAIDLRTP